MERPAYTRETLATALRFGTDPAGQVFNDVMPRYPLSDRDMSILISYLEYLSAEPSPGASSSEFRFATIITDDVSPEDRQALLLPLQAIIAQKNQQLALYNDFIKFGYVPTADMKYAFRQASLDVWELKGPPETWQSQLAAYYSKKPVFAVLGGISNSDWQPVHDFCEAERLPCLFPITDFPVISETGWYTYYFDKGYAQEGEAVARYLNRLESLPPEQPSCRSSRILRPAGRWQPVLRRLARTGTPAGNDHDPDRRAAARSGGVDRSPQKAASRQCCCSGPMPELLPRSARAGCSA